MIRQLWFDLLEALHLAEEVAVGEHVPHGAQDAPQPWLVLDVNTGGLWFTPHDAPRPRSRRLSVVHADGPVPRQEWPLYRRSLTEPDPDGANVLQQLRDAASDGRRWLVLDASIPPRLHTLAAYETDTAPARATWIPAYLTIGGLGPYPGQIARGYQHSGAPVARFEPQTVVRIAVDSDARAARDPERPADLLVLRDYGNGLEAFLMRAAGAVRDLDYGQPAATTPVGMKPIHVDGDGWYPIVDNRWRATQVRPPMIRSSGTDEHLTNPPVFGSHAPGGARCTVCGASGYDIAYQELPSTAGYGTDTSIWCRICGSSVSFAEEVGWATRRAVWPPTLTVPGDAFPMDGGPR
ncbi:hypothetical protein [Plantactinospora sp. CA-290183]|uniref:hypothetical protein n=1 Tax=Plantactinospora sp. CA-290183 TaxID=3240006 RepID=UPI003D8D6674